MTPHPDLEARLRAGLRAAAEAIPPRPSAEATPGDDGVRSNGAEPPGAGAGPASADGAAPAGDDLRTGGDTGRRRALLAVAAAAALTVVVAASVTMAGDDDGDPDVEATPADETTTSTTPSTTAAPEDLGPAVDPAAGSAVVIGTDLVAFGPDGRRGDTLSLAPLTSIGAVTSDRHGGWIACGDPPRADPPADAGSTSPSTTDVPEDTGVWETPGDGQATDPAPDEDITVADQEAELEGRITDLEAQLEEGQFDVAAAPTSNVYRFRAGQEPEPLGTNVLCVADGLGVTEVAGHDVLVYASIVDFALHTYDLASGAITTLPIAITDLTPGDAAVGGGRLAIFGPDGLEVTDLATGDPVPTGPVDLPLRAPDATTGPAVTGLVLAPDGATMAVQVGEVAGGPSEVVVIDLASGRELLRRSVPVPLEGSEIAYDGTTVAIGSFYGGQVHVFDVASGAERTIEAHGVLP